MVTGLEHDKVIRHVRRHWIGCNFSGSKLGEYRINLGKGFDPLFELHLHFNCLREAGTWDAHGMQSDIAFIQTWYELATHPRSSQARQHHHDCRNSQHQRFADHDPIQQRRIALLDPGHQPVFFFTDVAIEEECNSCRDERHREDHGPEQGCHHRERHRVEHLAFHAGQRKYRQVHHHNDQLAKQQWTTRLLRSREHLMEALVTGQRSACCGLGVSQATHAVLYDHHGTIDDDAEIECAKAHQVRADLVADHARKGEQHRQRNHHCCDERCTDVTQEQEQDSDNQQSAFDQVLLHRIDGFIDQYGAVIDRLRYDSFRQVAIDLLYALVDSLRYIAAVLTNQHKGGAEHHLLTVFGGSTGTQFFTQPNFSHITDTDRNTIGVLDDDVGDVSDIANLPRGADQELLAAAFNVARTNVGIIALQRNHNVLQAEAMCDQALRYG